MIRLDMYFIEIVYWLGGDYFEVVEIGFFRGLEKFYLILFY